MTCITVGNGISNPGRLIAHCTTDATTSGSQLATQIPPAPMLTTAAVTCCFETTESLDNSLAVTSACHVTRRCLRRSSVSPNTGAFIASRLGVDAIPMKSSNCEYRIDDLSRSTGRFHWFQGGSPSTTFALLTCPRSADQSRRRMFCFQRALPFRRKNR